MSAHSDHSSDSDNNGGEGERWDDWIEELAPSFSLFDDSSFATSDLALQHDKAVHGVDLILLCSTLGMAIFCDVLSSSLRSVC